MSEPINTEERPAEIARIGVRQMSGDMRYCLGKIGAGIFQWPKMAGMRAALRRRLQILHERGIIDSAPHDEGDPAPQLTAYGRQLKAIIEDAS